MSSREEWGNITWTFFHTLSLSIKEEKFMEVKKQIFEIIFGICDNLPCPDCSKDAIMILKKSYINNVQSKNHLIEFLRQFHNIVNIKLGKDQFSINLLIEKYHNQNIYLIYNKLFFIFSKKAYVPELIAHNFKRDKYIMTLKSQITNIKHALHY